MEWWREKQENAFETTLRHVRANPVPALDWNRSLKGLTKLLSLDADPHALDEPKVDLGFNPTETQLNKALGHFLEGNISRTRSFLKSLYEGKATFERVLNSFDQHAAGGQWEVKAEEVIPGKKRRMDLVIGWPEIKPGKCKHVVVVEIKFGHHVTSGQLSAYRAFVMKLMLQKKERFQNQSDLFLLSRDGETNTSNKDWLGISWQRCLSRWEKFLMEENLTNRDRNFLRFRRMLWKEMH